MDPLSLPPITVVVAVSVVAGLTALWKCKIPNAITLPFVVGGFVYHFAMGGVPELCMSLVAAAIGAAILGIPCIVGTTIPGDIKLMAGAGAWLGMPLTFHVYVVSMLAVATYALVLMIRHGGLRRAFINGQILLCQLRAVGRYIGLDHRFESGVERQSNEDQPVPLGAVLTVAILVIFALRYW